MLRMKYIPIKDLLLFFLSSLQSTRQGKCISWHGLLNLPFCPILSVILNGAVYFWQHIWVSFTFWQENLHLQSLVSVFVFYDRSSLTLFYSPFLFPQSRRRRCVRSRRAAPAGRTAPERSGRNWISSDWTEAASQSEHELIPPH